MYNVNLNNKPNVSFSASPSKFIKEVWGNSIQYMNKDKFKQEMDVLRHVDNKTYNRVIESVDTYAKKLGIEIDSRGIIENGAYPDITKIPIGRGGVRLFAERFKDFIIMPANAVLFFFKRLVNLVLHPTKPLKTMADKLSGKKIPKKPKEVKPHEFTPIFTKNALALVERSSKSMGMSVNEVSGKIGKDPAITKKFKEKYGEHISDLFGDEKGDYDAATASTWFKMTALISIPLKVVDAYNVAQTKDGDASMSMQKAKERLGQDLARHGLSTWITAGFNSIFREIGNRSILGAASVASAQTIVSEVLTRVVSGNAVLPKTRDQLIEMEDNTLDAKGLKGTYYRFMSRITGRKPLREILNYNKDCLCKKQCPVDLFTSNSNKQSSPLAEKASIDPALIPNRLKNS